jgi:hypothetical protein
MCKLFLIIFLSFTFQQRDVRISPDGNFKLTIDTEEESDLQIRYIVRLTDNISNETVEIVNCVRRDLPKPNFYWDKDSKYLVLEQCTESFKDSRIKIFNLKTKKIDFELTGLIGNKDDAQQQFDSENGILIYFDTSIIGNKIPDLYTFDLQTKRKRKIQEFRVDIDMEFPEIKRIEGKRQLKISYSDSVTWKRFTKQIDY